MSIEAPIMDSNDTITSSILTTEKREIIGENNLLYIKGSCKTEELRIILNYLKNVPQQGSKISILIGLIGVTNLITLIEHTNNQMMITLIIHVKLNKFAEVFKKYSQYEIIHTINKFNPYNISNEGVNHVLINAINQGKLPGYIDDFINIFRRTKRLFNNVINNSDN